MRAGLECYQQIFLIVQCLTGTTKTGISLEIMADLHCPPILLVKYLPMFMSNTLSIAVTRLLEEISINITI